MRATLGADPGRRRAAGDDHRIRPAVVGAAAGVAVPRRRRRAQDAIRSWRSTAAASGMSGALDCRDLFDRQEMLDQAQFQSGDDPVANLGAITQTATTSCTDTIAPGDSAYDNAHAAEDIERLRSTWDVPDARAARRRQRRPGRAGLRRIAPEQGGPAGARLPAAAGHRRRGRDGATRQGRAGRARRLRRAVRSPPIARSAPDPKGAIDALLAAARSRQRARAARRWRRSPTRSPPRWPTPAATASTPATTSPARRGGGPLRRRQPDDQPDHRPPRHCARPTASSSTAAATR